MSFVKLYMELNGKIYEMTFQGYAGCDLRNNCQGLNLEDGTVRLCYIANMQSWKEVRSECQKEEK